MPGQLRRDPTHITHKDARDQHMLVNHRPVGNHSDLLIPLKELSIFQDNIGLIFFQNKLTAWKTSIEKEK